MYLRLDEYQFTALLKEEKTGISGFSLKFKQ